MLRTIRSGYFTYKELKKMNFKKIGENVLIDKSVLITKPESIEIGNNVRIDKNCLLSISKDSKIIIKNNVHIAPFNLIYTGINKKIIFGNHSGLAANCKLYGKTENYNGDYLMNPTHKDNDVNMINGDIILNKFATLGCNSTLFPNSIIPVGTVLGAYSLYNGKKELDEWSIYTGIPIKFFRKRSNKCILLSEKYRNNYIIKNINE